MRIRPRGDSKILEGDLTPMIDMTFQLIAFFMLVINFADVEQDQRITLPLSELAQPPDAPYELPLTIHVTGGGRFIFAGNQVANLSDLRSALQLEKQIIKGLRPKKLEEVTIIIRADQNAKIGLVQEIIQTCQDLQFEIFALRGEQSNTSTLSGT